MKKEKPIPEYLNEIDRVFLINLERRDDRLKLAKKELRKAGIKDAQIFKAVDGEKMGLETIKRPDPANNIKIKELLPGMLGCYLSHYMIWREALEHGYKNIMVLEDDFVVSPGYYEIMNCAWAEKPANAQMIYMGYNVYGWSWKYCKRKSVWWQVPGACWGTHGYILMGKRVIKYLYDKMKFINKEIDSALWSETWPEKKLKYYGIMPQPFMQRTRNDTNVQKIK